MSQHLSHFNENMPYDMWTQISLYILNLTVFTSYIKGIQRCNMEPLIVHVHRLFRCQCAGFMAHPYLKSLICLFSTLFYYNYNVWNASKITLLHSQQNLNVQQPFKADRLYYIICISFDVWCRRNNMICIYSRDSGQHVHVHDLFSAPVALIIPATPCKDSDLPAQMCSLVWCFLRQGCHKVSFPCNGSLEWAESKKKHAQSLHVKQVQIDIKAEEL